MRKSARAPGKMIMGRKTTRTRTFHMQCRGGVVFRHYRILYEQQTNLSNPTVPYQELVSTAPLPRDPFTASRSLARRLLRSSSPLLILSSTRNVSLVPLVPALRHLDRRPHIPLSSTTTDFYCLNSHVSMLPPNWVPAYPTMRERRPFRTR